MALNDVFTCRQFKGEVLFLALLDGNVGIRLNGNGRYVPKAFEHKSRCNRCNYAFHTYLIEYMRDMMDPDKQRNFEENLRRLEEYVSSIN